MSAMENDMSILKNLVLQVEAEHTMDYFEDLITAFMRPGRTMFIALKVVKHGGQPVLLSKNIILGREDATETELSELLSRSTSTFRLNNRNSSGASWSVSLEEGLAAAVARMKEHHKNG